jgi:hypothetical protein
LVGLAVGTAVGLLSLRNPVHSIDEAMQPVGGAVRLFGEVSRAQNLFYLAAGFL